MQARSALALGRGLGDGEILFCFGIFTVGALVMSAVSTVMAHRGDAAKELRLEIPFIMTNRCAVRHESVTCEDQDCHNHSESVRRQPYEPGSAFLYEIDRSITRASDDC